MNDTFELKRFGLLLKKTILERPMQLMGLTGLVLVATLLLYSGALYLMSSQAAQNIAFIWGFVGGGCFLAASVFGYFNTNASGAAYLTLPASAFEKWLCGIIIAGVLFTTIFLSFYRLMDAGFVAAYHNGLDKKNPAYKFLYNAVVVYPFTFDSNVFRQSIFLYANLGGAALLGSLYFNKVSAIKVALVYFGVIVVIYFLNLALAHIFFLNVDQANPFFNIFIKVGDGVGIIELPPLFSNIASVVWAYIIPAALWGTVLIRLREKEI